MPKKNLTLSLDSDIIALAKKQAEEAEISISEMFSNFIKAKANIRMKVKTELGQLTQELTGILKVPPEFDYKETLTDALMEKYGLKNKDFSK
jgi:hypothetical protein